MSAVVNTEPTIQSVEVFGRKKIATAVAYAKKGSGLIKVNGRPLEFLQPEILRIKLQEPTLIVGKTNSLASIFVALN